MNRRHIGAFATLFKTISGRRRPDAPSLMTLLTALPKLVRDVATGKYAGTSKGKLALMGLALAYIVSPLDLAPEFLFLIGIADDAFVLAWLAGAVLDETEVYVAQGTAGSTAAGTDARVVPGEIV